MCERAMVVCILEPHSFQDRCVGLHVLQLQHHTWILQKKYQAWIYLNITYLNITEKRLKWLQFSFMLQKVEHLVILISLFYKTVESCILCWLYEAGFNQLHIAFVFQLEIELECKASRQKFNRWFSPAKYQI